MKKELFLVLALSSVAFTAQAADGSPQGPAGSAYDTSTPATQSTTPTGQSAPTTERSTGPSGTEGGASVGKSSTGNDTFVRLDKNGDGEIAHSEAKKDKKLSKHFRDADTDGNGKISRTEFETYAASGGTTGKAGGAGSEGGSDVSGKQGDDRVNLGGSDPAATKPGNIEPRSDLGGAVGASGAGDKAKSDPKASSNELLGPPHISGKENAAAATHTSVGASASGGAAASGTQGDDRVNLGGSDPGADKPGNISSRSDISDAGSTGASTSGSSGASSTGGAAVSGDQGDDRVNLGGSDPASDKPGNVVPRTETSDAASSTGASTSGSSGASSTGGAAVSGDQGDDRVNLGGSDPASDKPGNVVPRTETGAGSSSTGAAQSGATMTGVAGEADLATTFAALDTNADGKISRSEAQKDPKLYKKFKTADANSDGNLDQKEYETSSKM